MGRASRVLVRHPRFSGSEAEAPMITGRRLRAMTHVHTRPSVCDQPLSLVEPARQLAVATTLVLGKIVSTRRPGTTGVAGAIALTGVTHANLTW